MHLIIDGYGSNADLLQDEGFISQLLEEYPAEIDMTRIAPPCVLRYVGAKPEDWGVSGIVLIAESHISIHTFVERRYVNIDVFSCKHFDAEKVVKDLGERLQLTELKFHLLDRDSGELNHLGAGDKVTFVTS